MKELDEINKKIAATQLEIELHNNSLTRLSNQDEVMEGFADKGNQKLEEMQIEIQKEGLKRTLVEHYNEAIKISFEL